MKGEGRRPETERAEALGKRKRPLAPRGDGERVYYKLKGEQNAKGRREETSPGAVLWLPVLQLVAADPLFVCVCVC